MPALRNGSRLSLGQVAITPVTLNEVVTQAPVVEATIPPVAVVQPNALTTAGVATQNNSIITSIQQNAVTSADIPAQNRATIMNPIVALRGTPNVPQPNPVTVPSNEVPQTQEKEIQQPTLAFDTFARSNGVTVKTPSSIRPDLLSLTEFKPFYRTQNLNLTNFGSYLDDLYKSSVVQDIVRRYILASQNQTSLAPIISAVNNDVNNSVQKTQTTVSNLDTLISIYNDIKKVLDVKTTLGSVEQTQPTSPLLKLPEFFTDRMLFSAEAYNSFSDTKIAYQLIADLSNIMNLCSFNLLDNFQDLERLQSPNQAKQGSVVDPITIDTTYGTGLRYSPKAISNVVVSTYTDYNNIANVLPSETDNKIKFLINLISKEFKVSYGLGVSDRLETERTFFGFGNSGNPFKFVNGVVPSDIFLAPNGANSLSSLFYQQIEGNAVVLPLEARQVAGDGETVFVPGIQYFGDGILNNNLTSYETYRDKFSTVCTQVRNVYDGLLLAQPESINLLTSENLLDVATYLFKQCQDEFKPNGVNSDSTSILLYILFFLSAGNPKLKFEVYNLLILLAAYDLRPELTLTVVTINKFRQNLFNEISNISINGEIVTEENLETLVRSQIEVVRSLFLENIQQKPNINGGFDPTVGNYAKSQITVALEQFSTLTDSLKNSRCGPNLFKAVISFTKNIFDICSVNDESIHLSDGSTSTRFNGLTTTGFILLAFEMFSSFTRKFSTDVVTNLQTNEIVIDYRLETETVETFVTNGGSAPNTNILQNYKSKLIEENQIITNILEFFRLLNFSFANISTQQVGSLNFDQLKELGVSNLNLGSIRVAKSILKSVTNKITMANSTAKNMEFYIPSGKYISSDNWYATKIALADPKLRTLGNQKIATIGVPKNFLDAALGARLSRKAVSGNSLNIEVSDLINVKIFKLSKNDEGLIYDPVSFKFDMSLFPYGFDGMFILEDNAPAGNDTYANLIDKFQFYDFDESVNYSNIVPKTLRGDNKGQNGFLSSDPFYITRQQVGIEVVNNLYTSFILDNYLNTLTGLNFNEETFVEYKTQETNGFTNAMRAYQNGDNNALLRVKNMSNSYQNLLRFFSNKEEQKLMLTICNDIEKTILKPKMYDRTFHVLFDPNKFSINVNATRQTPGGNDCLENLLTTNQTEEMNGLLYRKPEIFEMVQYFISVEIIS